jgi:hypothetical protein
VSPSFVINLMTAFGERGGVAPKALGGWRHSKLDPHRVFILRRVAEKDDITMPELAAELLAARFVSWVVFQSSTPRAPGARRADRIRWPEGFFLKLRPLRMSQWESEAGSAFTPFAAL